MTKNTKILMNKIIYNSQENNNHENYLNKNNK